MNKIIAYYPGGYSEQFETDEPLVSIGIQPVTNKTSQLYKTTDKPTLQARNLISYSRYNDRYSIKIYLEGGIRIQQLQTAEYIDIITFDGKEYRDLQVDSLNYERIDQTNKYDITIELTHLYKNNNLETSYLTHPEIGETNVNKLVYNAVPYTLNEGYTFNYIAGRSLYDGISLDIGISGDATGSLWIWVNEARDLVKFDYEVENGLLTHLETIGYYSFTSFYICSVIFTKLIHTVDIVASQHDKHAVEGLQYLEQSIDFDVIKQRFYLTLEQKIDLQRYIHVQKVGNVQYIDYLGNKTYSLECIEPVVELVEGTSELYTADFEIKTTKTVQGERN